MTVEDVKSLIELAHQSYESQNYTDALKLYVRAGLQLVQHKWQFPTGMKIRGMDLADVNGDGSDEVIVASEDTHVYVLDHNGKELWRYKTNGWVLGAQALDIDQDGEVEIIAGSDKVYVLNSKGELKTSFPCVSSVSSLCVQGSHLRDSARIITGHDDGQITAWNIEGKFLWRYYCPRRVICMLAEDIDQDGKIEVVAGSEDKNIYILNSEGGRKDVFESNHWILSIVATDVYGEGSSKLLIASFEGDVHIYRQAKTAALNIKQHGILGINLAQILPGSSECQVILGSSDRGVSILDLEGNLLWRFNTSYGHRMLQVKAEKGDAYAQIIVGAEDGAVHSYSVRVIPGLVTSIRETYARTESKNVRQLGLSPSEMRLLGTFIDLDPINRDASLRNIEAAVSQMNLNEAIDLAMELWRNGVEFRWSYHTGGRIYAIDVATLGLERDKCILAGSEDGNAYALRASNGSPQWIFATKKGVRGIHADYLTESSEHVNIAVGSVDGNLYLLNHKGEPLWNFQTQDWVLYTHIQCIDNDGHKEILFGSDSHYIAATRSWGQQIWKYPTEDRVRAVTCADIDGDGFKETIAGCDDKYVYILDSSGQLKRRFETPHWVLVIRADDIDDDGQVEILLGTEDGHLYVYSPEGELKWKYQTGHWIAALDTYRSPRTGEKLIAVGSADRFVYGLSGSSILLWRLETSARVRTLRLADVDGDGRAEVIFGSYDQHVYLFSIINPEELRQSMQDIADRLSKTANFSWERLIKDDSEPLRAFACLHSHDEQALLASLEDESDIVRASAACSLVGHPFITRKEIQKHIAELLLREESLQVRLLVYRQLRELPDLLAAAVFKFMGEQIHAASTSGSIVDLLLHLRGEGEVLAFILAQVRDVQDSWVSLTADRLAQILPSAKSADS